MEQAVYHQNGKKICGDAAFPESLSKEQMALDMPAYDGGYFYTRMPGGEISVLAISKNAADLLAGPQDKGLCTLETFYAAMLSGSLSTGEIMKQLPRFRRRYDVPQTVVLLNTSGCAAEDVRDVLEAALQDYSAVRVKTASGEYAIVLETADPEEVMELSDAICDTFLNELQAEVCIGIGEGVHNLQGLAVSCEQARSALQIGKNLQHRQQGVWRYKDLLPEILLSALPREAMANPSPLFQKIKNVADEENLALLDEFFHQNLNVSQTAKALYMHRNTLIYRLEKLNKATGMDLSSFEDAVLFRLFVALMRVNNHGENA